MVHIVNISDERRRLHIINPCTSQFRLKYDKKGVVAPGMSQVVTIYFQPSEYRYHYDTIRLHTENDNLLIPLHGYPVVNELNIPKRLDFGHSYLTETAERTLSFSCTVPIPFEFEIDVIKPHPYLEVSPVQGIIPANGSAQITVRYTPEALGTHSAELRVSLSQFNFQPYTCQVTGSSLPGQIRQDALEGSARSLGVIEGSDTYEMGDDTMMSVTLQSVSSESTVTRQFDLARPSRRHRTQDLQDLLNHYDDAHPTTPRMGGSGNAFDAGGAYLLAKKREELRTKKAATMTSTLQLQKEVDHHDTFVDGVRIPYDVSTQNCVNFILTQERGKYKPKELQQVIRETRRAREEQQKLQDALRMLTASVALGFRLDNYLTELSLGGQNRQMKELLFLQDVQEVERMEREREFKASEEWIGERLLSAKDVEKIEEARRNAKIESEVERREVDRKRIETEAVGPFDIPDRAARAETILNTPINHVPQFNVYKAEDWRKRTATVRKFVYLVSKWIVRRRAEQRLRAIKGWLGPARTRQEVKEMVAEDWKNLSARNNGNKTTSSGPKLVELHEDLLNLKSPLSFSISAEQIKAKQFPVIKSSEALLAGNEEKVEDEDFSLEFDDLKLFPLKVPKEIVAMGYTELPLPLNSYYPPIEVDRPLRTENPPAPPTPVVEETPALRRASKKK